MVTVPTFESLPTVTDAAPQLHPGQPLGRFETTLMQRPGEATEQLGGAINSDAQDADKIANAMATQQNEDGAKKAAIQTQGYINNLGFVSANGGQTGPNGEPAQPGFYALKGQAAVDAAPGYMAAIQAQQQQSTQGMTQQQKNIYLAETNGYISRESESAQRHVMLEAGAAATQVSQARIQNARDTGVLHANDPDAIEQQAQVIRGEAADEARRMGQPADGPVAQAYTATHLSGMYRDVVLKNLASGDVAGAGAAYTKYGPLMTGPDSVSVGEKLQKPLLDMHASQQADTLAPQQPAGAGPDAPYLMGSGYYNAVHGGEGNGVNPTTKATGPVQVIPSTLNDFHASAQGQGVDVNTPAGADQFTKWYGDQNAAKISAATGKPATNSQVTMAHLLGPDGAIALLTHPDEPIGKHLTPGAIANNPGPLPSGNMTGAQATASIGDYYAKAAGMPTAAQVAAATKAPRPDFEGAIGRVPNDPADPALHEATVNELKRRANVYDIGEQTDRDAILKGGPGKPSLADTMTALENGRDAPIDEVALRHAFKPGEADAIMAQATDAKSVGGIVTSTKYATPEANETAHQALIARLNTGPIDGAAQAQKTLTQFERAQSINAENLKKDAATYVRAEPTVAPLYAANDANPSPAALAAAVTRSMAVQRQLGVTPQALTNQTRDNIVAGIHRAKVEDVPGMMDQLKKSYGDAWPDVARQIMDPAQGKLDPGYAPLLTMASGPGRTDYAAALVARDTKGDKFGAAMDAANPTAKTTMETQINNSMESWRSSFPEASGSGTVEAQTNAVRLLATYYADSRGREPAQAVKDAYTQVIGNTTDVHDAIRTPRVLPDGTPMSVDKVLQSGATLTAGLTADKLLPEKNGNGETLQSYVTSAQARAGRWVTNPDGMSVSLTVPRATGGSMRVYDNAGKPITMDYRALPQAVSPNVLGLNAVSAVQ